MRRDQIERQIDRLEDQLIRLDTFGSEEDYDDGTVITFGKQFGAAGKVYSYAAIKAGNGIWYLTGSGRYPNNLSWDDLVVFLSEGVGDVWIATEWEEL